MKEPPPCQLTDLEMPPCSPSITFFQALYSKSFNIIHLLYSDILTIHFVSCGCCGTTSEVIIENNIIFFCNSLY